MNPQSRPGDSMDPTLDSQANGTEQKAKVEIYTWRFCPYCIRAKGTLDRKGVIYNEYMIDGDDTARQAMIRRADGRSTLPQIFINNRPIGGCDDLLDLEQRGLLDRLLVSEA
jgi:glutaredoxin 3